MMLNMQASKQDLKNAPAEGQMTAISHCGDTYTVKTADSKSNKVWEFNLRFKTDSSALGPQAGRPVIVGAGMQGDRASVVFAAPGEISGIHKRVVPVIRPLERGRAPNSRWGAPLLAPANKTSGPPTPLTFQ